MPGKGIILVGGFSHESNSFTPLPMMADDFWMCQGDFTSLAAEDNEYAGALRQLNELGYCPRPVIATGATVGGIIEHRLLDRYIAGMLAELERVGLDENVVGLQWVLHGSSLVQGAWDVQEQILRILRSRFSSLPLVVSMDLHSTVTAAVLELVDGLVHYRTAPHVDMQETGRRASRMLDRIITSGLGTERLAVKIPLLLPGEFGQTGSPVMTEIYRLAEELAKTSGALDVSISQGFPWADNPEGVVTVVGVWPRDTVTTTVQEGMRSLARQIWHARHTIYQTLTLHKVAEVGAAAPADAQCIVFCDSGDNPTAGAPEDRVDILASVLARGVKDVWFVPIVDAEFARQCRHVTPGDDLFGSLGGRLSETQSLAVRARVVRHGHNERMGTWAVVDVESNLVLVVERRFGVSSPQLLADCGFDLEAPPRTMVVKSGYLFAPWKPFLEAHHGIEWLLDTPGATTLDIGALPYRAMSRACFPLTDTDAGAVRVIECRAGGPAGASCVVMDLS